MIRDVSVEGIGLFSEYNVYLPPKRYDLSIALVYPSTYSASITNLFTHIAYYFLNERLNVLIDRFTMDNPNRGALTGYDLRKFDIILASVSFELDLPYLVNMLIKNKVNPNIRKRKVDDPFIIIGGPPATANPLPYSVVADTVFVGEGEVLLSKLVDLVDVIRYSKDWKELLTDKLVRTGYCYSIKYRNKVKRAFVVDINGTFVPEYLIRSRRYEPVYGDGYYLEVSRGCKWLCSFCMEAFISYPFRYRSKELIMKYVIDGVKNIGKKRVVFYSLSFFDHPESDSILKELLESGISYNVPSIRYTTLNESRIDLILGGGQRTITIAPETLSCIASRLIRKEINMELLRRLCLYTLKKRANLKLYFILGLPCEGEIVKYVSNFINELIRDTDSLRKEQIRVSINPLIPKPNTPMQYLGLIRRQRFRYLIEEIQKSIKGRRYVRFDYYDWRWAYAQTLIALGNERAGELTIRWGELGCGLGALRRAIKELRYDDSYVFKVKDINEYLPWSEVVDTGLNALVKHLGSVVLTSLGECDSYST